MRITRAKENEVEAKIVGMDEDMEEKEEAVTTNTLTMEKEVGIHKFSKKVVEKANFVEEKGGEEKTLFLACQNQVEEKRNKWYLDTGASNHMCGDRSMFVEINEATTGNVSFGDDLKIPIKGKGKIIIRLKNGSHQFISNVYYVPNMKNNILSLGQLLKKGYDIHLKEHSLFLRDCRHNLIAKVHMSKNRIYLLNIQNDVAKCLKTFYTDSSWLWHL
ncbi:uncharacterized protein LOC127081487 [Lathyrus oleraceus]|uniref:uncharacterized protein LOC127081487 n=1 Tax=Pisum sativum TaxID=3888 RepID=UPI0021D0D2DE|nr:uncharacterized protein LOC127081487 [Pisum sativum]